MHHWRPVFAALLTLGCSGAIAAPTRVQGRLRTVTVPMQLELNRTYIDVTLVGPDGQVVRSHAWVDTGGGAILLSAKLARQLGIKSTGKPFREEGQMLAPIDVPAMRIGGMPIELEKARAFIATDAAQTLMATDADMALPAAILRKQVVVFDYPAHTFTVAQPGSTHDTGTPVNTYIGESGMPVTWISVAGQSHPFLIDTGGQFCMVSSANLHDWMKQKPDWQHVTGAYGPANMLAPSDRSAEMLSIGEMQWGPFLITGAGAVSRPVGTYEKWMSVITGQPIVGAIGGNVLKDFRVTIDYPAGKVYLQRPSSKRSSALDIVGITLTRAPQGGYVIAGTAADVRGIQLGDRLLTVDGKDVTRLPYYRVSESLRGRSGEARVLGLMRDGKPVTITETVRSVF